MFTMNNDITGVIIPGPICPFVSGVYITVPLLIVRWMQKRKQ